MKFNKVHIVGIGGISMSGIAKVLLQRGINVSGSDIEENDQVAILKNMGADIHIGHRKENIQDADAVVYTNAVSNDNVELKKARESNIKIYKRAQFLSELFKNKATIAVTGTHGKTTTTSMLASIFIQANLDPSVMVGGNLDIINGNIKNGKGEDFITEADESDGSLIFFDPKYAVITNIELDHFNYYNNEKEVVKKYEEFIDKVPPNGAIVLWDNILDKYPKLIEIHPNTTTYGINKGDYTAKNIRLNSYNSSFDLYIGNNKEVEINLNVPGKHNILNALAAFSISHMRGLSIEEIAVGLEHYKGVKRRFEKKGEYNGALIIDDYAHHPTEIINTIETAVRTSPNKLYAIFQPHRYSRTKNLMEEFSLSFDNVDELILTDIYSASEKPIPGINSKKLFELIEKRKQTESLKTNIKYISDFKDINDYLKNNLKKGDLLLTIGAGNVYEIGEELVGE